MKEILFSSYMGGEIILCGVVGIASAASILAAEWLAPGAVIFAATTVFAVVSSALIYALVDRLFYGENIKSVNRTVPGVLLSFLAIGTFVGIFTFMSGITGLAVFPFVFEIFIMGMLSLGLLNDINTIITEQKVYCLSFDTWEFKTKVVSENDNPAWSALVLFSKTVDLFLAAVKVCVYMQRLRDGAEDSSQICKNILNTLLGCTILFGMFYVVKSAFSGDFMRPASELKPEPTKHGFNGNTAGWEAYACHHFAYE